MKPMIIALSLLVLILGSIVVYYVIKPDKSCSPTKCTPTPCPPTKCPPTECVPDESLPKCTPTECVHPHTWSCKNDKCERNTDPAAQGYNNESNCQKTCSIANTCTNNHKCSGECPLNLKLGDPDHKQHNYIITQSNGRNPSSYKGTNTISDLNAENVTTFCYNEWKK